MALYLTTKLMEKVRDVLLKSKGQELYSLSFRTSPSFSVKARMLGYAVAELDEDVVLEYK